MTLIDQMFKSKDKRRWRNVYTIDPGLGGTGWAHWGTLARDGTARPPDETGVIRALQGSIPSRITSVAYDLKDVIGSLDWGGPIAIESAALWSKSAASQASAERGDLFKLSMLIGALIQCCDRFASNVVLVPPGRWKGQMDKRAVHARILRALGVKYREHEADAVGMGLAMQGVL